MSTPVNISAIELEKIFKRDDIRGIWPDVLNSEIAYLLGELLFELLSSRGFSSPLLAIGHDARSGSYDLSLALQRGFCKAGGKIQFLGLISSEQLYYTCGRYPEKFAAGAMITASHNPKDYNGMKFVHSGAIPFNKEDLDFLKNTLLQRVKAPAVTETGQEFAQHLLQLTAFTKQPNCNKPLKIVIAAGNGVGALAFKPLAEKLSKNNCEFTYLDPEPDGNFPNDVPDPLQAKQIKRLGEEVIKQNADLGIIFDGDADRAGFVDHKGQEIIPSQVLAIIAQRKLRNNKNEKPLLMRNICCSELLKHLVDDCKGKVELLDTPVGHGQIKLLMRSPKYKDRVVFAGEHSGHYFYPEFYYVDSAFLSSLYLIAESKELKAKEKNIAQALQDWREKYKWSGEINYLLPERNDVYAVMKEIEEEFAKLPNTTRQGIMLDEKIGLFRAAKIEGEYNPEKMPYPDLKIHCQINKQSGWWLVIRPSGNENKLRLNFEQWNLDEESTKKIKTKINEIIKKYK
jgi:phosphomannomutase